MISELKKTMEALAEGAVSSQIISLSERTKLLSRDPLHEAMFMAMLKELIEETNIAVIVLTHELMIDELHSLNFIKAFRYCELLAETDDLDILTRLALFHKGGFGTTVNIDKAIEILTHAIEIGSVEAIYHLAMIYKDLNNELYLKWLKIAADKGDNPARFELAKEEIDLKQLAKFAESGERVYLEAIITAMSKLDRQYDDMLSVEQYLDLLLKGVRLKDFQIISSLIKLSHIHHIFSKDEFSSVTVQLYTYYLIQDDLEMVNNIQNLIPCDPITILIKAVKYRAPQITHYLFERINVDLSIEVIDEMIATAANNCDATLTLFLSKDESKATEKIFSTILKNSNNEKLYLYLLTLLRFSAIDVLDELIDSYTGTSASILRDNYLIVKSDFLKFAPFQARLSRAIDIYNLPSYENINAEDTSYSKLETGITHEKIYSLKRRDLAERLHYNLKNDDNHMLSPKRIDFLERLPPSSNNARRAAALLEEVVTCLCVDHKDNSDLDDFASLRTLGYQTPLVYTYGWAIGLVESVKLYSQAIDIMHNEDGGYSLTYKVKDEIIVTTIISFEERRCQVIQNDAYYSKHQLQHGRAPIEMTWPSIEDIFEKIINMKFEVSDDNCSIMLKEFYELSAELVWLIGNTQAMKRGTGSFAEMTLALIHLYHGLQPPVLKAMFPQLDVLDLCFPLSDYKSLFTHFFEPSTLPEEIRPKHPIFTLALPQKMKTLYEMMPYLNNRHSSENVALNLNSFFKGVDDKKDGKLKSELAIVAPSSLQVMH